jgi:carbamoyltransferase
MIVLGLNHGEINSSAALYINGEFVAAAPEERFNRQKRTKVFPQKAIEYCLSVAGITLKDCDYIAQAWNPGAGWHKNQNLFNDVRSRREGYFYSLPEQLLGVSNNRSQVQDWVQMSFPGEMLPPLYYVHHHRTHAANAFFLSEFQEAAILTADFRGEFETASMSHGKGTEIKTLGVQKLPHSLGMLYAAFTELLGYKPDNDEWKVMAISAFDVDDSEYYTKIKSTIKLTEDGFFELDQSYYKGAIVDQPNLYTPKLVALLGGRVGKPGEEIDEWFMKVSRAMQRVSEDIAVHMLEKLYSLTKSEAVVLGGGFFMNCVFNGKVLEKTQFKKVYISHSPADVGNCFGAASYVAHCIHNDKRVAKYSSSYTGPEYSDQEIEQALQRRKIRFEKTDQWEKKLAGILATGEVVALMNGRMEFGERALGNRSILADPRQPNMKDKINSLIKFREGYRPFAPATLFENSHLYFEVDKGYECPYMEKVVNVKDAYRSQLPAITHVDGSARLQTVKKDQNKSFHAIIDEFGKLTGLPIVTNTSFNINGEPVVMSPDDALNTFFNSGLEHLFISKYYITKK